MLESTTKKSKGFRVEQNLKIYSGRNLAYHKCPRGDHGSTRARPLPRARNLDRHVRVRYPRVQQCLIGRARRLGSGFRFQGSGFRVQGSGFRVMEPTFSIGKHIAALISTIMKTVYSPKGQKHRDPAKNQVNARSNM